MNLRIMARLSKVREALHEAGKDLNASEWKELLEELSADLEGQLDAVKEENPNL